MPTYADTPQTIANMYFIYKWSMIVILTFMIGGRTILFIDDLIKKIRGKNDKNDTTNDT